MDFSRTMLRALGQGVDRLHDGDPQDRRDADQVVSDLQVYGYIYEAGTFNHEAALLVNGHLHPMGCYKDDLTLAEKEQVIQEMGSLLPEMYQIIDENRYLDLPLGLLIAMWGSIRDIRNTKGLRVYPEQAQLDFVNNRGE